MKGAVILIGSLLWETEENALNKEQGSIRIKWRKNLDIENKTPVQLPIRYGRKSSSKKCTYTMVFSNSVKNSGTAYLIPFNKDANNFSDIKEQALQLSIAEGISTEKYPNRLIATWGAVAIYFNRNKKFIGLKENWSKEFMKFNNSGYRIGDETPSINSEGQLNFEIDLPQNIDYVFATPVKPELTEYPNIERIAEAILESKPKYDTYAKENYRNGIRVYGDDKLIKMIK
jgi:hypothetical protein